MNDYGYPNAHGAWQYPPTLDGSCPWGGFGNYNPADEMCDFECRFRNACIAVKKRTRVAYWRQQIIAEVTEHQRFITAWRKFSFRERCLLQKKTKKRGAANTGGLKLE
jgi:hypothetical protein